MAFWQFRTGKRLFTRPDKPWWNVWEAYTGIGTPQAIASIANSVVQAEKQIHLDLVEFFGWEANLYIPNSDRFDPGSAPEGFASGPGLRPSVGIEMYDIEMCYQLKFKTHGRAFGKKAFRACCLETEVTTVGTGKAQLTSGSTLNPGGSAMLAFLTALGPYIAPPEDGDGLTCYTRFQTSPRGQLPKIYGPWAGYMVQSVQYMKLGNVAIEHGWFNRAS